MQNKLMKVAFLSTLLSMTSLSMAFAFNESPMLKALVDAGKLPPVDQRLPKKPAVIPVYGEIGTYGGTLRRAYSGIGDRMGSTKLVEERAIKLQQSLDGKVDLVNRFVESWSANADSTEFTFSLLDGMKWSDGQPVTTDDVKFWYEDIFLNSELSPAPPGFLFSGGKPFKLDVVDKRTFKVKFEQPYALFPYVLAVQSTGWPGLDKPSFIQPAHYLKKFLPKYTKPEELDAIVKAKGVANWRGLWDLKGPIQAWWLNPDLPVVTAYKVVTPPPASTIVFERNPYYWATDKAGNQLPYIDRIEGKLFQDHQALNLMVVQGQIDFQSRFLEARDYPLLKENEKAGNYTVHPWKSGENLAMFVNIESKDPVKAKLFNDVRFREALSVAIDREAINETVFSGLATPRSASPAKGSPYYDADFEKKWTGFDINRANALLDQLGLKKGADGFRTGPDGKRLSLVLETVEPNFPPEMAELVRQGWQQAGIEGLVRTVDENANLSHLKNSEFDVSMGYADRLLMPQADPTLLLGRESYANGYFEWFNSDGKSPSGVEPPADHPIRKLFAAWKGASSAKTIDEANKKMNELIGVMKDNVWMIGLVGESVTPFVVSNKIGNFPDVMTNEEALRNEGNAIPAQLYFKK
ncbi:ABC transporter substrate-binding protein [Rhizobium oryzicola]|uniref:ABC transporter substrate-binding protein n=1 Tax=Rhizobium oryzicola TaxID=1232668 RepID=A0ABT8T3M6_9HYPH|nr:ABC transporter substrate-binding protein [Rhizobium oryzicola]MDO1585034.1 ABC transporter substrate-binding protein [Rhizobium oryzicola]